MNDGQIRALIAICDSGSMTKAAGQLYLSVPAIKKQIDSLEKEMEVTLFSRTNKGVKLTKAGEEFLVFSRRMMGDLEEELRKVRTIHNQDNTLIRIGFDNQLVRDCVFHYVVFDYKREHRDFTFTTKLCEGFDPTKYDIFFGANHSDRGDVRAHYLCDLPLTCLVPKTVPGPNARALP